MFKRRGAYLSFAPGENSPFRRPQNGDFTMYIKELDYGTPLARKTAAILAGAVLVTLLLLPLLAVGLQIVA